MEPEKEKKENKYIRGKIYKLTSGYTGFVYIGSTINTLSNRLSHHRTDYNRKVNITSTILMGLPDIEIVLLCNFPCNTNEELRHEERKWINLPEYRDRCVNLRNPITSDSEKKIQISNYRKVHQEKYTQRATSWRKDNRNKFNEHCKNYYYRNRDRVLARKAIKHNCECGGRYTNSTKTLHFKTQMHLRWEESQKHLRHNKEWSSL